MIKFWAKTIKDNKIKKSIIFENATLLTRENFEDSIFLLCQQLDEPSPIILTKHYKYYMDFNISEFKAEDFVENVMFDKLVVENALTE